MVVAKEFTVHTTKYIDIIPITEKVERLVEESPIKSGVVHVITMHTTTGITINENLECLLDDIKRILEQYIPEDAPYAHGRVLHTYGTTAGNPTGHIKSFVCGNHIVLPVENGKVKRGGAQDIFLCEFDGAQSRKICVSILGE